MKRKKILAWVWLLTYCGAWALDLHSAFAIVDEPSQGQWRWVQALDAITKDQQTAGAGCFVWLEEYSRTGTSPNVVASYREYKRCGVTNTFSGNTAKLYKFPNSATVPTTTSGGTVTACFPAYSATQYSYSSGLGSTVTTTGGSSRVSGQTGYFGFDMSATSSTVDCSNLSLATVETKKMTCSGGAATGSVAPAALSPATPAWNATDVWLYEWTAGSNGAQSTCTAGDQLLRDFGPIAQDCTATMVVRGNFNGYSAYAADCTCIPLGHVITSVSLPNTCNFAYGAGRPEVFLNHTDTLGATRTTAGQSFTNSDLNKFTSGESGIPIEGTDPNGGFSPGKIDPGAGQGGWIPNMGPSGPTGTSPVSPGHGPGGSGSGTGGTCASTNCNDDGSADVGTIPASPTFNPDVDSPDVDSWTDAITTFISGSPVIAAITGSGISASGGSCSLSTTVMGASVDLGFCDIPSSLFTIMSIATLAIAHLLAFYIIFV